MHVLFAQLLIPVDFVVKSSDLLSMHIPQQIERDERNNSSNKKCIKNKDTKNEEYSTELM